jgi:hypothetical protein
MQEMIKSIRENPPMRVSRSTQWQDAPSTHGPDLASPPTVFVETFLHTCAFFLLARFRRQYPNYRAVRTERSVVCLLACRRDAPSWARPLHRRPSSVAGANLVRPLGPGLAPWVVAVEDI